MPEILKKLDFVDPEVRHLFFKKKQYLLEDLEKSFSKQVSTEDSSSVDDQYNIKRFQSYFTDCYNVIKNRSNYQVATLKEIEDKQIVLKHKSLYIDCSVKHSKKPTLIIDLDETLYYSQLTSRKNDHDFPIYLENGSIIYVDLTLPSVN